MRSRLLLAHFLSRWTSISLFLLFSVMVGCHSNTAEVSGKVTYQNKPVNTGMIMFLIKGHSKPFYATIEKGGTYSIKGIPIGDAIVTVSSSNPHAHNRNKERKALLGKALPRKVQQTSQAIDNWFPIPEKYNDVNASGLTVTIETGVNTFDIPLH